MTKEPTNPAPSLSGQHVTDPEAKHWHEYRRKTVQETPQRLEEAAKYLAGVQALALSLYLGLLEQAGQGIGTGRLLLVISMILWLASVGASLLVIFPVRRAYDEHTAAGIEAVHRRIVRWKYGVLVVSAVAFFGALVVAGVSALVG